MPSGARLSRRDRRSLLLGALAADPRGGRGQDHRYDGRDSVQGRAGCEPRPLVGAASSHDHARAHAELAPALRRVDAIQDDARSRQDRPCHDRTRRSHHEGQAPSRAGLPRLSRHSAAGQELRFGKARSGLPARQRHRLNQLRLDQIDPAAWPRQSLRERDAAGRAADPAQQHPRHRLLPLSKGGASMLIHPTHNRLVALGLVGMAKALEEQRKQPDVAALDFDERLALLVDRETTERENKRLVSRLRFAGLRQNAVVEDVDLKAPRGLDKALFQKLVAGDWIDRHHNLLIIGPTGVGKSWIACALAHKACRDDRSVLYQRLPRLFDALALARGDGRHERLLKSLARVELLILDDWGLAPMTAERRRDLLEIMEDRHARGSTIVTSQLPVEHWHDSIGDPTFADAILDRLVHNAHRLTLKGESLRKAAAKRHNLDAEPAA